MAISLRVAGSWAEFRGDGTVTIPATPQAGDRMFLFVAWKTYTITLATPADWTAIGTAFADGTTGAGNGTGSVKVMAFYRDWVSGVANPYLDFSANPAEAAAVITVWQKAASELWSTPLTATAALSWGTGSTTTNASSTTAVPSGGVVLAMVAFRDDSATMTRGTTGISDSAAAITWNGNHVESPATHGNYTAGSDGSYDIGYRLVTTGATATLRVTGTLSASETGSAKWVAQGVYTATSVNAPTVTASVMVPPRPVGGELLTGQPGYGRLGLWTLGNRDIYGQTLLSQSGWVKVDVYPAVVNASPATKTATVAAASTTSVNAPHVTVTAALPLQAYGTAVLSGRPGLGRLGYWTLGDQQTLSTRPPAVADVADVPAVVAATGAVTDGAVTASGASVAGPLVTAAGAVSDALADLAVIPAAVDATGAVIDAIAAAAVLPGMAEATAATAAGVVDVGILPDVATAAGAVVDAMTNVAPAPAVLAAAAADLAASASTSVYASIDAPLATAAADPLAPEWHITIFADATAATGATADASVSSSPLTSAYAPLVTVDGATTTTTAVLDILVSVAVATGAASAPLPAVAAQAPVVTVLAGSQQGGVSGGVPTRVGGGPAGSASALVPQISGAYPSPSGEASSMRPT
jgi:hypothetical protein